MAHFHLTPGVQDELERAGIDLRQAHGLYPVGAAVAFEPPLMVAAELSYHWPLRIGAFSHLNGGFIQNVSIGRYCSFARDVQIGHGSHPVDWLSVSPMQYSPGYRGFAAFAARNGATSADVVTRPFGYERPTRVGNDVWLGNHVFVVDGVTIGDGAIVGAGTVVTRDVEPYTVVAGHPARAIRLRFEPRLVDRLLRLRWWRFALADLGPVDFTRPSDVLDHLEARLDRGSIAEYAPGLVHLPLV